MESRREDENDGEKNAERDYMSEISGNLFCREVKTEHLCLCNIVLPLHLFSTAYRALSLPLSFNFWLVPSQL